MAEFFSNLCIGDNRDVYHSIWAIFPHIYDNEDENSNDDRVNGDEDDNGDKDDQPPETSQVTTRVSPTS